MDNGFFCTVIRGRKCFVHGPEAVGLSPGHVALWVCCPPVCFDKIFKKPTVNLLEVLSYME